MKHFICIISDFGDFRGRREALINALNAIGVREASATNDTQSITKNNRNVLMAIVDDGKVPNIDSLEAYELAVELGWVRCPDCGAPYHPDKGCSYCVELQERSDKFDRDKGNGIV